MSDGRKTPSLASQGFSAAVVTGCFLLFGFIVYLTYLPGPPETRSVGSVPSSERAERLTEMQAAEAEAATRYQWIDQSAGVVRLPVDRAMELTRKELGGKPL